MLGEGPDQEAEAADRRDQRLGDPDVPRAPGADRPDAGGHYAPVVEGVAQRVLDTLRGGQYEQVGHGRGGGEGDSVQTSVDGRLGQPEARPRDRARIIDEPAFRLVQERSWPC